MWLIRALAYLPLPLLYFFSGCLAFWLGSVMGYRRRIIEHNLTRAFGNPSAHFLQHTRRRFYRQFADIIVETIVSMRLPGRALLERVTIEGDAPLIEALKQPSPIVVLTTHQGNWEWLQHVVHLKTRKPLYFAYQRLQNSFFDKLILRIRSRFGAQGIVLEDFFRHALNCRDQSCILALLADQRPRWKAARQKVRFFSEDVYFLSSGARLAIKLGAPIFMAICNPTHKRGYYRLKFYTLASPPYTDNSIHDIVQAYAQHLENSIKEQPANWLWSHNRWKY